MKLNNRNIIKLNWDIIKLCYNLDIHGFDYIPIGFGKGISNEVEKEVSYEVE